AQPQCTDRVRAARCAAQGRKAEGRRRRRRRMNQTRLTPGNPDMKTFKAMMLALTLLLPAAPVPAQVAADEARGTAIALLDAMDAGDYAGAEAMMNAEMAAAVPAARLQAVWESLPAQAGDAQGRGEPTVT